MRVSLGRDGQESLTESIEVDAFRGFVHHSNDYPAVFVHRRQPSPAVHSREETHVRTSQDADISEDSLRAILRFEMNMDQSDTTRRRFGIGLTTLAALPLAGCLGGDDDDDDDETPSSDIELGDRDEYDLTIHFVNEDGEPVSEGITGRIEPDDSNLAAINLESALIFDGAYEDVMREADYEITIESTDDAFDEVEEEITLDEDTEIEFTLEGAAPDEDDEESDE